MLFINCSKMARLRIDIRSHAKEKPYTWWILIFCKIRKATLANTVSKMRVCTLYVSEICAGEAFAYFPWRLKMWKVGQKIAIFFSSEPIFNFELKKIHFSRENNLSYTRRHIFAYENGQWHFSKTRDYKNKHLTHFSLLK